MSSFTTSPTSVTDLYSLTLSSYYIGIIIIIMDKMRIFLWPYAEWIGQGISIK